HPLTALHTAAATLGNIGLGLGPVGPSGSYGELAPALKWILSLLMIAGRLELYTLHLLLTPSFWRRAGGEAGQPTSRAPGAPSPRGAGPPPAARPGAGRRRRPAPPPPCGGGPRPGDPG